MASAGLLISGSVDTITDTIREGNMYPEDFMHDEQGQRQLWTISHQWWHHPVTTTITQQKPFCEIEQFSTVFTLYGYDKNNFDNPEKRLSWITRY